MTGFSCLIPRPYHRQTGVPSHDHNRAPHPLHKLGTRRPTTRGPLQAETPVPDTPRQQAGLRSGTGMVENLIR